MPKAVTAKSGDPAGEKKREDGAKASRHPEPLNLEQFKDTPVKGAAPILRLRSRDKIAPVLASPDFAAGVKKLALDAAAEPKAAVALSKLAVRPEFSSAVAEPVKTAGRWPEPSKFKNADDRQCAADALARLRPSWALPWLAQALVGHRPAILGCAISSRHASFWLPAASWRRLRHWAKTYFWMRKSSAS